MPKAATAKKEAVSIPCGSNKPVRVFRYEDRPIKQVSVYPWPNHYTFFSGFQKNALAILEMPAEKAPVVPFFSFMPQYHQLTAVQLRFYLYWRKCFYEGIYLQADLSYLLLFVYEIINLPSKIPPRGGVKLLVRLWSAYRKTYPKLDKYLAEWVCDYCLINGIDSFEIPRALALQGIKNCSLPEFYMNGSDENRILLSSAYDYKKSRFYTNENKELFDTHIQGALAHLERTMTKRGDARFASEAKGVQKIARTSFDGAVCVYSEKKRIEILYTPKNDQGTGGFASDAVKFCENRVRAALMIRSRFSTPALSGDLRAVLEQYFNEHLPAPTKKAEAEQPEYDSKYEPESHGFSAEETRRIEEQSLQVALRLGSVFEEEKEPLPFFDNVNAPIPQKREEAPAGSALPPAQKVRSKQALALLLQKGHEAFLAYAKENGLLAPSLADEINEAALDLYGDVAIEETDGKYAVIEDYKEEVTLWINS